MARKHPTSESAVKKGSPTRVHDKEALKKILQKVTEESGGIKATAKKIGIAESTLGKWIGGEVQSITPYVYSKLVAIVGQEKLYPVVTSPELDRLRSDHRQWTHERIRRLPTRNGTRINDRRATSDLTPRLRIDSVNTLIVKFLDRYPSHFITLFTAWRKSHALFYSRLYLALIRIVEPLAEWRESGLVECFEEDLVHQNREAPYGDLIEFIQCGIRREVILLDNGKFANRGDVLLEQYQSVLTEDYANPINELMDLTGWVKEFSLGLALEMFRHQQGLSPEQTLEDSAP